MPDSRIPIRLAPRTINNVPEAIDRVHLSPKKAIARRLAKRGAVLRSGEALEIPT